jgi:SsrA-binding protein
MKVLQKYKKATFDFSVHEEFSAGVVLQGWMVKAILAGRCNLDGVYIKSVNSEIFTVGFQIIPLANTDVDTSNGTDVKLLLNKREITKISEAVSQDGFSIIPVQLEYHGSRGIKMKIALAKGKKNYDKRADQKVKDLARIENANRN